VALALIFGLSAAAAFADPVTLIANFYQSYYQIGGSQHWLDGFVQNVTGSSVTDVVVRATARRGDGTALGTYEFPADAHVVPNGNEADFHEAVSAPAGTVYWTFVATGEPTTALQHIYLPSATLTQTPYGALRHTQGSFANFAASVSSVLIAGREWENSTNSLTGATYLDSLADRSHAGQVMVTGTTYNFDLVGARAPANVWVIQSVWAEWVVYTPQPVYRFYNRRNGSHFYTASEAEKAHTIAALSSTYTYEGAAFQINTSNPSNVRPLYRFYNRRNGSHFYTASEAEKAHTIAALGSTYSYDGPAYQVSTFPYFSQPVYRFYNRRNGTHFYTASESERAHTLSALSSTYSYDGIAYYLAY